MAIKLLTPYEFEKLYNAQRGMTPPELYRYYYDESIRLQKVMRCKLCSRCDHCVRLNKLCEQLARLVADYSGNPHDKWTY